MMLLLKRMLGRFERNVENNKHKSVPLHIQTLESVNFAERFLSWCTASLFYWEFSYWSMYEWFDICTYEPKYLCYIHPPIRVMTSAGWFREFSVLEFNRIRGRLLRAFWALCEELEINGNSAMDALALGIIVAEFVEDVSFELDLRWSDFANQVLGLCIEYTTKHYASLNDLARTNWDELDDIGQQLQHQSGEVHQRAGAAMYKDQS